MPHVYRLDPKTTSFLARVEACTREIVAPRAAEVDDGRTFPEAQLGALAKTGLLGVSIPTELGGLGLGPRAFVAAIESVAGACASTAMIAVMHVAATQAIVGSTTLSGRDALLAQIASGKHLTTLAFSERGSRSQFWAPVSRLRADGDRCLIDAEKSWVTSARHAASYVALAQAPDAKSPAESTLFLVRTGASSTAVAPTGFDGLGLRGNDSAPVRFSGHPIAAGDLLCEQGKSEALVMGAVLPWFAIGTAAMAAGLARAATSATRDHLAAAGFEHTGQKLRDLPNLRARLAQMSVRTEATRALIGHALDHLEDPSDIAPLFVLQARLSALETATEVTDLAMKTCGGAAFSRHLPVERLFRDARAGWVMAPTVDHLQDFVGRALTGLPLFG
jgi:alkylation response protein AidB-like acyl-CoA dehydrogenase